MVGSELLWLHRKGRVSAPNRKSNQSNSLSEFNNQKQSGLLPSCSSHSWRRAVVRREDNKKPLLKQKNRWREQQPFVPLPLSALLSQASLARWWPLPEAALLVLDLVPSQNREHPFWRNNFPWYKWGAQETWVFRLEERLNTPPSSGSLPSCASLQEAFSRLLAILHPRYVALIFKLFECYLPFHLLLLFIFPLLFFCIFSTSLKKKSTKPSIKLSQVFLLS